jgi:hypothetical protein
VFYVPNFPYGKGGWRWGGFDIAFVRGGGGVRSYETTKGVTRSAVIMLRMR